MAYIVFDIGGTKMRVAKSTDGVSFSDPVKVATPTQDVEMGLDTLFSVIADIAGDDPIDALAGGIAGTFNKQKSELVASANIAGWVGAPIAQRMQERFNVPVYLENDTAVVGLGEVVAGAGSKEGIVAYITVSTGVGGVRIVDGVIDRAAYGFEIGHQYIDFDRSHCADCPDPGDLESYISGKSLEARHHMKAYEIDDPVLWEHEARLLAVGLMNTIVHWSPDVVVLGGSMIVGSPGIDIAHVQAHVRQLPCVYPELPQILRATCGDTGGLRGALELLAQRNSDAS